MDSADFHFYSSIVLRRLPVIAGILSMAVIGSGATALMMPRIYRSSAKILVEAPQIPVDMVRSTVAISSLQQLQIIQQQITSRTTLIELATHLDLYATAGKPPSPEDIVKDMRSRLVFEQQPLGTPADGVGAAVFSVAFEANDPDLAAKGANELASLILSTNQRQRTDRAGDTLQFFNEEVARLGNELSKAEGELLKFKTANRDTLPENLEFRRQQQKDQQLRLTSLEREAADLRTRRSVLVDTFAATGQTTSGAVSPKQQVLDDLNRALADQLTMFSETSPNIVALRARIASMQREAIAGADLKADHAADIAPRSGIELQLADIDKRLQEIEAQKVTIASGVELISQSINATPATETTLNSLERNKMNLQTQYNAAIGRRADASLGEQVETRSGGGRVTLLEEAMPPENPVKPKRRLIVALGLAVGVGMGLALVALLEFMNRTIRRPHELADLLQSQPLAVIPYIAGPQDSRAMRLRRGLTATFSTSPFR